MSWFGKVKEKIKKDDEIGIEPEIEFKESGNYIFKVIKIENGELSGIATIDTKGLSEKTKQYFYQGLGELQKNHPVDKGTIYAVEKFAYVGTPEHPECFVTPRGSSVLNPGETPSDAEKFTVDLIEKSIGSEKYK